jgi:hypothetical protein
MALPSTHQFTSPIRLFKANDPYFWQVDNIPLSQLIENDLWLKDQIGGTAGGGNTAGSIDRSGFTELLPYSNGSDDLVRVKPGRFMARVNDASQTPILTFDKTQGQTLGTLGYYTNAQYQINFLQIMSNIIASNATNNNGLMERALTFIVINKDTPYTITSATIGSNSPQYPIPGNIDPGAAHQPFPLIQDFRNALGGNLDIQSTSPRISFFFNKFVQRWRGVARTAVVDVPTELSIIVPPFDPDDFFYVSGATIIPIPATQRIDLVFIYTHPIDATATKIQQYGGGGNTPTTINRPTLGILKGAGLGILQFTPSGQNTISQPLPNRDNEGFTPVMIPNESDTLVDNGFSALNIHGSFPSPEDLLNLAPLLADSLQTNDLQIIGQSVLPVCYVLIKNTTPVDTNGNPIISSDQIIDIRPFFRTAELSYAERTGIAGAVPPLSLGNPAVGQIQIDEQITNVINYVNTVINEQPTARPSVLAGGIIRGGVRYGVEGALLHQAGVIDYNHDNSLSGASSLPDLFMTDIANNGTFQLDVVDPIPLDPEWDIADWTTPPLPGFDVHRNDYIHDVKIDYWNTISHRIYSSPQGGEALGAGDFSALPLIGGGQSHFNRITFIKKKINFGFLPAGLTTYDIVAKLQYTGQFSYIDGNSTQSETQSIWVEKYSDHFIIYVAFPVHYDTALLDPTNTTSGDGGRDCIAYSTFITLLDNPFWKRLSGSSALDPLISIATYPTVTWEMVGYPPTFFNHGGNGSFDTQTITLN